MDDNRTCSCSELSDENEVIVCRCEEITKKTIETAILDGHVDLDAIKRATRAGMGMCQSKSCAPLITRMIAQTAGISPANLEPFTKRSPLRPIRARAFND